MLFDTLTDRVISRLPTVVANYFAGCIEPAPVEVDELRAAASAYWQGLAQSAESREFVDLETAKQVFLGCSKLLDWLGAERGRDEHLVVQAAVRYFILEDDAEGDDSIVGFDDDLQVVEAAAHVLGVSLSD